MAFSAKQFSIFLILTLFSSLHTHARDSQYFNKIPSTTTNDVVAPTQKEPQNNQPQQQDPTFLPEKENAYGLYGHESGQNPPSTATTTNVAAAINTNPEYKQPPKKYLPKNYNPVAYVTQPEDDINDSASFSNNNYLNGGKNYYNNPAMQGAEETEFHNYQTNRVNDNNNNNGNYYYNGAGSDQMKTGPTRYGGGATRGGGSSRFQPQGMSDTRFLENGKYFYDINAEKETNNRPYEAMRGSRTVNDELYDKYSRNFNENNGYENYRENNREDEFQADESLP